MVSDKNNPPSEFNEYDQNEYDQNEYDNDSQSDTNNDTLDDAFYEESDSDFDEDYDDMSTQEFIDDAPLEIEGDPSQDKAATFKLVFFVLIGAAISGYFLYDTVFKIDPLEQAKLDEQAKIEPIGAAQSKPEVVVEVDPSAPLDNPETSSALSGIFNEPNLPTLFSNNTSQQESQQGNQDSVNPFNFNIPDAPSPVTDFETFNANNANQSSGQTGNIPTIPITPTPTPNTPSEPVPSASTTNTVANPQQAAPTPPPPTFIPAQGPGSAPVRVVQTQQQAMQIWRQKRTGSGLVRAGAPNPTNPVNAAGVAAVKPTSAPKIAATTVGDLNTLILEGKMIDAVLESAINTDLPGPIRGIVSRDVYSESGTNVLINKGSRLIGSYSAVNRPNQVRVEIRWERLIRPDGIDIQLNSTSVDPLGRAGTPGKVNNKYFELISSTAMLSVLTIGGAIALEDFGGTGNTTTTTTTATDGSTSTTSTGSAADEATLETLETVLNTADSVIGQFTNANPTIYVNQGTSIKVFVSQDLTFPVSTGRFID